MEVLNCPDCSRPLKIEKVPEAKMITVKCSTCGEISLVEEGTDLMKAVCESCGTILKEVERGFNYLVIDRDANSAYDQFKSLVKKKVPGLCLSTTFPEKLKKEYDLENVDVYWLSDTSTNQKTLDPRRLDFEIMRAISNFVKKYKGGVVMLEGVEYLAVENTFDKVLKFIKKVNDLASVNDATLFVPISPGALSEDELYLLKMEFDRVQELTKEPTSPGNEETL